MKFNGGLGNQMFQYAFAKGLEKKSKLIAYFDMSFFKKRYARAYELSIFGIDLNKAESIYDRFRMGILWKFRRKLKQFLGLNIYLEPCYEFSEEVYNIKEETYVEGFYQSEKYFEDIKDEIRKEFTFKIEFDEKNKQVADEIKNSKSVSLHIRRGDYVSKKRYQNMFAACSLDYYKNAVEIITKGQKDFKLFIFSDDIQWVKENLNLPYESVYIDFNKGADSFRDMQLMSLCKHNVIANSSFSWWGAWLNSNPEKIVIAPKTWFNDEDICERDMIPQSWIRIEN